MGEISMQKHPWERPRLECAGNIARLVTIAKEAGTVDNSVGTPGPKDAKQH
jgi:hypothetical protein